ncbi:hypothetical protein STEG23_018102, partial [Scotinomys teguina]
MASYLLCLSSSWFGKEELGVLEQEMAFTTLLLKGLLSGQKCKTVCGEYVPQASSKFDMFTGNISAFHTMLPDSFLYQCLKTVVAQFSGGLLKHITSGCAPQNLPWVSWIQS